MATVTKASPTGDSDQGSGLEAIKQERKVIRTFFTKNANLLESMMATPTSNPNDITSQYIKIHELQNQLVDLDKEIRVILRSGEEESLVKDMESAMEYRSRWIKLDTAYKSRETIKSVETSTKKSFKLPRLEFIQFDGNIKNWLAFWGQFSKIDKDPFIDITDKYQYLLQATKEDSEVRRLVETFTPITYKECLEQVKNRYAREELLIQVYVRELLAMVNQNTTAITPLFDKLSAHLRALESLGVTKDKFAAFLLPMIESAIPQDILKIWERTRNEKGNSTIELAELLKFLKNEVESEQRITMAKTFEQEKTVPTMIEPTANCLLTNMNVKNICLWCDKNNHTSLECYKLHKMSIEERRECIKKKKACAVCLKKGHHAKVCKAYVKCIVCGRRHAVVLCTGKKDEANEKPENISTTAANLSAAQKQKQGPTLLQTVTVIISNGDKQATVRAMYDNGAQRSYIKEDVARQLGIPEVGKESLSHTLFGGVEMSSKQYKVYELTFASIDRTFSFQLSALGQSCICHSIPKYSKDLTYLLTKHNITLTDSNQTSDDIGLLIGADYSGLVLTGEMVKLQDSLVAIKTKLGWTLQGKITGSTSSNMQATHVAMFCSSEISNFWSLETLGIRDPLESKTKQENELEVLATFEENVEINKKGRYEVHLPWKVGHDELLNNYDLATRRLESVTKKLETTGMYEAYNKVFIDWHDQGIIQVVRNPEENRETSHYLPHRPVIKESSLTTPIRPVFDASAKDRQGKSVNLCLYKGINFLDKIPKLLNGFRKGEIGITADIAKAFLQISVTTADRDMLRFLWWDREGEMITYRHCRVVFGLTSSPFLLSATIQHHLNQVRGDLQGSAELLATSFYVDNLLTSLDTEKAVQKFEAEAKEIMSQAKFDLRQWVISPLPNQKCEDVVNVLGLQWQTSEDQLSCNMNDFPPLCEVGKITKRNLLSITQRIYDPIGFTSAVTLTPRLILQETWRRKLDWDAELPSDLKKKFMTWYESLHFLRECKIPRRLTTSPFNENKLQLHMFCDASRDGYAACVYLRAEYMGKVSVRIISAKSRIAPPERITIPRLELLAALIGSRLLAETRRDLKLNCEERCWTDSGVALCWIKRELIWNTYVGNRVKQIRENTNVDNWFHIPGTANWADLASRGCDAAYLHSSRWVEGPSWLSLPPEEWPNSLLVIDEVEANRERKKSAICSSNICSSEGMINQLDYFSKYTKIIREVAWILRFVHNARHLTKLKGELSYEEYEESEKRIIKIIQTENRDYIEKRVQSLTHFYDEKDILRIKTKLLLTDIPESTKYPAVLPATSFVTRRLVDQRHAQLQHAGLNTVLADLRSKYWIIGARQLVKSIISRCNVCKRHRAKPIQVPTAPLPIERTQCSAPFEITGVDLAGPLYLGDGRKCWIVLYTCAVYRAVHLELTQSLSTEAFLMTLRRFIARRGRVNVMISDNGTNFIGTKNLISELDWEEIQRVSTIQSIKWKLNAPKAAWWGGFWERLIRILKDLLKRVLGKSSVTYEELETILCDCEATLNGRPLTYIEDDKTHSLEPLKPSHFLQPITQTDVTEIDEIDAKSLNKRLRYIQKLREDFRQRFKTEYLTTLVQKGKERKDELKLGEVVLIETEDKRIKWPIGIVVDIISGRDGVERTARVKTSSGYKVRPFQRLYKLEVSDPDVEFPRERVGRVEKITQVTGRTTVTPPMQVERKNENAVEQITRSGRVSKMPSRYLL